MNAANPLTTFLKNKARGRVYALRRMLKLGALPNALILGTMKGGTTSLFEYLIQHPSVGGSAAKEPQFFDTHFHCGVDWYRAKFWPKPRHRVRIEASPHTLFHPLAPQRVRAVLPEAKLIVLLRDPIARAYSHYQHWIELGYETLSFREALARETERIGDLEERLLRGENLNWLPLRNFSYVRHGQYAVQIARWLAHFPRERFLFLKSEEMFSSPQAAVDEVCRFLDLPPFALADPTPRNQRHYPRLEPDFAARLAEDFRASNSAVESLLGFRWDEPV